MTSPPLHPNAITRPFLFVIAARAAKAARVFPRPVAGALRPVVLGQTVRYNMKKRVGRGFTFEELKAAGISKTLAPTIGISVDHRRKNRTASGFERNVQRLKEYLSNLVVFPKNAKKPSREFFKPFQSAARARVLDARSKSPMPVQPSTPSTRSALIPCARADAPRRPQIKKMPRHPASRSQGCVPGRVQDGHPGQGHCHAHHQGDVRGRVRRHHARDEELPRLRQARRRARQQALGGPQVRKTLPVSAQWMAQVAIGAARDS